MKYKRFEDLPVWQLAGRMAAKMFRWSSHSSFRGKGYCKKMVIELVQGKGKAVRADIDGLLLGKLSDALSEDQKSNFITNLLQEMRRDKILDPVGYGRWTHWRMHNSQQEVEE